MDFSDILKGMLNDDTLTPPWNTNVDVIWEALERPRLIDLKPGDVLRQIKWGTEYRYKGDAEPVVFIRYCNERDIVKRESGAPYRQEDILIAKGVHHQTGELVAYFVDSTHYERVQS